MSRLGDFTDVPTGETLQTQGHTTRWCYWVVGGSAGVTCDGTPVATCGPGSLLPGGAVGTTRIAPASVVALGDLEVMAVGVREFLGALDIVPALDRAFHSATPAGV